MAPVRSNEENTRCAIKNHTQFLTVCRLSLLALTSSKLAASRSARPSNKVSTAIYASATASTEVASASASPPADSTTSCASTSRG